MDTDDFNKTQNTEYLSQRLRFEGSKLLDENNDAVMMGWEEPLMVEHAKVMCSREGLTVLNVGFVFALFFSPFRQFSIKKTCFSTQPHALLLSFNPVLG